MADNGPPHSFVPTKIFCLPVALCQAHVNWHFIWIWFTQDCNYIYSPFISFHFLIVYPAKKTKWVQRTVQCTHFLLKQDRKVFQISIWHLPDRLLDKTTLWQLLSDDHCAMTTTVLHPQCEDHCEYHNHCMKTTLQRPLCDNLCIPTSLWQPLFEDHCATTPLRRQLCANLCKTTTVWQPLCDNIIFDKNMTFL